MADYDDLITISQPLNTSRVRIMISGELAELKRSDDHILHALLRPRILHVMKEHPRIEFIQHDRVLDEACRELESAHFLGVDTEFVRECTYYPVFCLLQIATEDRVICIDPQKLSSVKPLLQVFQSSRALKIFHSARQDLEVLLAALGVLPEPLHDTQIAAGLVGYPDQIGYSTLVYDLFAIRLDKLHTRTDWSRRPLSSEQLRYAGEDVAYLIATHQKLAGILSDLGRIEWLQEDCANLLKPTLYTNPIENAWKRVKGAHEIPATHLNRLHALAAWREETAQELNLPRNWVLRDETLCELVRIDSRLDPSTLPRIRGADSSRQRKLGERLIEHIEHVEKLENSLIDPAYWTPRFSPETKSLLKECSALVQRRANELKIAPSLLASRRDLEDLLFRPKASRINEGWRFQIIGRHLLALQEGKRAGLNNDLD
jgi:ribonuclease D